MNKNKTKYYGILTTFNPYVNEWFAFSRSDERIYWASLEGETIKLGKGNTAIKAIEDYLNK